jgi:hypothetical protein
MSHGSSTSLSSDGSARACQLVTDCGLAVVSDLKLYFSHAYPVSYSLLEGFPVVWMIEDTSNSTLDDRRHERQRSVSFFSKDYFLEFIKDGKGL